MSETKMTLVFEGSAVENGAIDVQDLAPALISLGELIQAANRQINGDRARISIKMRAVSEGSFEVDLLSVQSIFEHAKGFFDLISDNKDKTSTANKILELLFKIGAISGGLIAFIMWLKGRKSDRIERRGEDVLIHIGDTYFIIDQQIIELEKNQDVREKTKEFISSLSKEGIENIKVRRPDSEDLDIRKEDIGYFEFDEAEEIISDKTRELNLQIISLSFKETNQWRVTDGGESFNVLIEDIAFLDKVANSEIAFSKGDFLVCSVREKQTSTSKGLKMERSIIEVKDHRSAKRQSSLKL